LISPNLGQNTGSGDFKMVLVSLNDRLLGYIQLGDRLAAINQTKVRPRGKMLYSPSHG
jgi:hypothetical protein